jgi:putative heme-binding domain-containing protein
MFSINRGVRRAAVWAMAVVLAYGLLGRSAAAEGQPGPAGPIVNLIRSGRAPDERLGPLLELVCARGNAHDLRYVFERAVAPDGLNDAQRLAALQALAAAAEARKVVPEGDLSALSALLEHAHTGVRQAAVHLAGLWKVESLGPALRELVLHAQTPEPLRRSALESLVAIGGRDALQAVQHLLAEGQRMPMRYLGAAALVKLKPAEAAAQAAAVLAAGSEQDDPAVLVDAFLQQREGADRLAAALAQRRLAPDVAKLVLRHMYSVGRSDASLVAVLTEAAGISAQVATPTSEEVQQLVHEALTQGDPARGEAVFRRADLSCLKCHAVSGAGGNVGPDLSGIGQSSPPDYLVNSVLQPDLAIKEQYQTVIVSTVDGEIVQGIVVQRDAEHLVLRDATGKEIRIATADIDEELEGKSLMPKGLVHFMTRRELVDLVAFLCALGKPGPYAVPTVPSIQRWQVLVEESQTSVAASDPLAAVARGAPADAWQTAYARVGGELPLDELVRGPQPLFLRGAVNVVEGGRLELHIQAPGSARLWIDGQPVPLQSVLSLELSRGLHEVTLRVEAEPGAGQTVRVALHKPADSTAQFTAVGGR